MSLLSTSQLRAAEGFAALLLANPFLSARIELERELLGAAYVDFGPARAARPDAAANPNTAALVVCAEALLGSARESAAAGARLSGPEGEPLLGTALFLVYHRHLEELFELAARARVADGSLEVPWYAAFAKDLDELLTFGSTRLSPEEDAGELLALCFQAARAYTQIFAHLVGRSAAAIELRASVWQSIFTHDAGRYRHSLVRRMVDVPTLITGPSGTGKELVARAVGKSGYVPFDAKRRAFRLDADPMFTALNLSALPRELIESELFGHRRGSFTGALEDRESAFERCAAYGTVFLDELAETDPAVQVKLLRLLQTREFVRVGDHERRRFEGRLVSATNRDLGAEIEAGRFREDLYYRVCADRIRTPRLVALIDGSRDELQHLLTFVAKSILQSAPTPDAGIAPEPATLDFAAEAAAWIEHELGLDYAWPGNFRELEQCARAILIRGEYRPERTSSRGAANETAAAFEAGTLTADELLRRYCRHVYALEGSYEGAARRLDLDRRTVKVKVSPT